MSMAALDARAQSEANATLGNNRRLSLVVSMEGTGDEVVPVVMIVSWLNTAQRVGQQVVLDHADRVKWSVATEGQFPYRSF